MPRAATKADLVKMANEQFDKLWQMIDEISEDTQTANFCYDIDALTQKDGAAHWKRDKNLRDILVHLYEWHQLLIEFEKANTRGENKTFLPLPYNWKNYGDMNIEFWKNHQSTMLSDAKEMLKTSHKQVMAVIEKHTGEQLFTKKFYNWTGTSIFGSYCVSATASHYDWAMKKLKAQIKALRN